MESLTIISPDDWHLHLRDEAILKSVLPFTERNFARAVIMPNLTPPIINRNAAKAYKNRIIGQLKYNKNFQPLMTCYLQDGLDINELDLEYFFAAKLYPAHATTNSLHGVTDVLKLDAIYEKMQKIGMPLLIHGEVTHGDIYDREKIFIESTLRPLRLRYPELRITLEHVTSKEGVDFVKEAGALTGATVTPHHLYYNRNHLFKNGLRPHAYCLPLPKRDTHQKALLEVVLSGHSRFFLGTDSAPHSKANKEKDYGCAGIFNAATTIPYLAELFASNAKLNLLENFTSKFGAEFYGLAKNLTTCKLIKKAWRVPKSYTIGDNDQIVPFLAGETIAWQVEAS